MQNKYKLFLDVLKQKFCAAMFDFDGTLAERRPRSPVPESLKKTLEQLSQKIPMALCTARPLKTALPKMENNFRFEKMKRNWVLVVENGCAGYCFNERKNDWAEFYRVKWPNKFIDKKMFADKVHSELREQIGDYPTAFQINGSSLIFQPSYDNADDYEIIRRCDALETGIKKILRRFKNNSAIKIINSKLGIIVIPSIADKDRGIIEFGEYLSAKRGKKFSAKFREIIAVGDQPGKDGNDEMFLMGRFGTPFTAGEILKTKYPLGIYKGRKHLIGPMATEYLLKSLKFC